MAIQLVKCRWTEQVASPVQFGQNFHEETSAYIYTIASSGQLSSWVGIDENPVRALELALQHCLVSNYPGINLKKGDVVYEICQLGVARRCQTHSVKLLDADHRELAHHLGSSQLRAAVGALAGLYAKKFGVQLELAWEEKSATQATA